MSTSLFDLNTEEVLENWEVEHAIREIISNALDEQFLSHSAEIEIIKDSSGDWHVRDFGRGLRYQHLTLKENQEKLTAPTGVIGKFGVGLNDAFATMFRRGINVLARSSFGTYRLKKAYKHGFDIETLHVECDDSPNDIQGTDFSLSGTTDLDMEKAKSLFLKFAGEDVLETNAHGQILQRQGIGGRVYISGVLANEEDKFLFSYNITSLTHSMKNRLNRERLNVGRTIYADRVKTILKNSTNKLVQKLLIDQVPKRATGEQCDEMAWGEIRLRALTLMAEQESVVVGTEQDVQSSHSRLDNIKSDGHRVVVISEQEKTKLKAQNLAGGPQVRTFEAYEEEYRASFEFKFVDYPGLTPQERRVYDFTPRILALVGITGKQTPDVRISETMRSKKDNTLGVWEPTLEAIVVKRSQLRSLRDYAATLLHEAGHATTGTEDETLEFEAVLTGYLGRTATVAISG
jgi:hypothetical protein